MNKVICLSLLNILFCCASIVGSPNKENRRVLSPNSFSFLVDTSIKQKKQEDSARESKELEAQRAPYYRMRKNMREVQQRKMSHQQTVDAIYADDDAREKAEYEAYERRKKERDDFENYVYDADDYDPIKMEENFRSLPMKQHPTYETNVKIYQPQPLPRNTRSALNNYDAINCDSRAAYSLPKSNSSRALQALSEDEIEDSILAQLRDSNDSDSDED